MECGLWSTWMGILEMPNALGKESSIGSGCPQFEEGGDEHEACSTFNA